jgi:hypothetical protein
MKPVLPPRFTRASPSWNQLPSAQVAGITSVPAASM